MIRRFLSCYQPRYLRSLVYMLQASEYNIAEYFAWCGRVEDFGRVEKRKQLVKTLKARLLWLASWLLLILLVIAGGLISFLEAAPWCYLSLLLTLLLIPYLLALLLPLPLILLNLLQKPLEVARIREAKAKLYQHPALKIAIAGSFGKTSMREILKTVLAEGKRVAAPPHSYNTPLGICSFIAGLTGQEEVLIFELGEYYPGDVRTLCQLVQPQLGIITGVNQAHLEKFKTLEKTAKTIFELADYLAEKPLYINGENKAAKAKAKPEHFLYSRAGVREWRVKEATSDLKGTRFQLVKGSITLDLHSGLLGLHQIGPLAAAAAIADQLGCSAAAIQRGIAKTQPFEHRLQPKTDAAGVIILDDSYNGNPDGVKAVIEFLATLKGRRFYLTPGLVEMGGESPALHREIGRELAAAGIEKVLLIRNSVTPFIQAGLAEAGYAGEILWYNEALEAFAALPSLTVKGDVVVLQNDWPDQYA